MSISFNGITIESVVFNGTMLDRIYKDGILIFERESGVPMFNFVGIDANGYYDYEDTYDGTPVAYGIGKPYYRYNYHTYTQVQPTPTEISGYSSYYVYNTETDKYVSCILGIPDWVVAGETPAFSSQTTISTEVLEETQNFRYISKELNYRSSGGLNAEFFEGIEDFYQAYSSSRDIPDLEIENIEIPSIYKGLPVIELLQDSFYAMNVVTGASPRVDYYISYKIKNFILGNNVQTLKPYCCQYLCRVSEDEQNRSFVFNNNLKNIEGSALLGAISYDSSDFVLRLPQSVENLSGSAFNTTNASSSGLYKLIISSPTINFTGTSSNLSNIADNSNYLVFENTVSSVSGYLKKISSTNNNFIVFKHQQNQQITLDIQSNKSAITCVIYTDNNAVINYDWTGKNYTVTFKSLSEYEGD